MFSPPLQRELERRYWSRPFKNPTLKPSNSMMLGLSAGLDYGVPQSISIREHAMRKVLRGYAKDKNGNLILIGTMPVPFSKDKSSPATRREKRHLVKQGATIFKKETIH
jgi:hypothetical protein